MRNIKKSPEYDLWWASVPDELGLRLYETALAAGSTERLFRMERDELCALPGISEKIADYILYRRNNWNYERICTMMQRYGIRFVPYYHSEFPKRLLQLTGHPFALFVIGELPPDDQPAIAVIGARNCTEYGRACAKYFARELSNLGIATISGMALGIDGIAQAETLRAGGRSYAILGSGPELCYPRGNFSLYQELREKGGLISEFAPGTGANKWHFPTRNRIIAGLSDAVLVVEARESSGTRITVDMAIDQGRDILVVPGRISDPLSVGCLELMKQGAQPVTRAEDIRLLLACKYENLGQKSARTMADSEKKPKLTLERDENIVYSCVDLYAKSADRILDESGLSYQAFLKALMKLELQGLIREVGKNFYVKCGEIEDQTSEE